MSDSNPEKEREQTAVTTDNTEAAPPHDVSTAESEQEAEVEAPIDEVQTDDESNETEPTPAAEVSQDEVAKEPAPEETETVDTSDSGSEENNVEVEAEEASDVDSPAEESTTEQDEEDTELSDTPEVTVESVIEAVLFASDEPVTISKLATVVEQTGRQIRKAINALNDRYKANGHAFRIEPLAGGFQMFTLPTYESWLRKLVKVRGDSKLSPAALETLAIVAYRQPVIRADIEAIRGVASGEILRTLMSKNLVKIVGRAEVIGRPMQYGTTKRFLEIFGLNSLKDLPTIEELKKPEEKPAEPEPEPAPPEPVAETPKPVEHPPAEFELEVNDADHHNEADVESPETEETTS